MQQRIQKIIAMMGVTSRRKAEEYIQEGRVTINGKVAKIGMKADPERDHIKLDGKLLIKHQEKVYLILNKPKGVITALSDPEGRPTIKDFLRKIKYRVFPVGRLDYHSEGLLLLTNDGELAHAILHPSNKIPKTYQVKVKGIIDQAKINKLSKGIKLEDGLTHPSEIRKISETENNSWLEVVLYEGKKRQIRRMFEAVGHPVLKLKRVKIDGIYLGDLGKGELRYLTKEEIDRLKRSVGLAN
ncbi:MAG: rRNA pseudouridine synthase [Thermodesulfovibrionales bacterium]|nr:rRNA pseudouridine synthase [Thermodesulfovibrionales bacterium]